MGSSAGGHDSGYPRDIASPNWHRTQTSPHPVSKVREITHFIKFSFQICRAKLGDWVLAKVMGL